MRKLLIPAAAAMIAFASCGKGTETSRNCPPVTTPAPASEVTALRNYISGAGITATEDTRGFFYTINTAGGTDKPKSCSNVTVNYTGKLTNGTQFDAANGITFNLDNLIAGWQEGIPLIGEGGKITLYLPPSLAYGSAAQPGIPANSILVFIIDLNGFD